MAALTPLAWAEGADGIYAAVDYGRTIYGSACNNVAAPYTGCSNHDQGHRVSMGMSVTPTMGGEIGYYNGGQTIKDNSAKQTDATDSVEWHFTGVRSFPVGDGRLAIQGRLGYVRWIMTEADSNKNTRITHAGNNILLGIGARYYLTGTTALRAIYEIHNAGDNAVGGSRQIQFISAGALYYF